MIHDKKDGPFRLEVKGIKTYEVTPPFSLTACRNSHRPLLVFSESGDDLRLRSLLAEIYELIDSMPMRKAEIGRQSER